MQMQVLQQGWERLAERRGGTVTALATARDDQGEATVFAATAVGIRLSNDAGQTWVAQAAGGVVSHVMIAATRKVKEKGEPELREAVKRGRIGVQDAAKAADLPPEQQKAIAESPKPRRAAAAAAEAANNAASRADAEPRSDGDRHATLRKAWERAKALRGLWDTADDRTKEWFVGAVLFDSDEAGEPPGGL